MQVETISMDPRIANIHFLDYHRKVREAKKKREAEAKKLITEGNKMRRTAYSKLTQIEKEDIVAMESYRAMMQGMRILNVATALRGSGLDKKEQLPVLAIAGAHWKDCWLQFDRNQLCFSKDSSVHRNYRSNAAKPFTDMKGVVAFSSDIFGPELTDSEWRKRNNFPSLGWPHPKAEVPTIPAHLRPDGPLDGYHILFEAKWKKEAPPDPILLKHLAGHMYAVLAQWDLTPVEKAVLEGRFA